MPRLFNLILIPTALTIGAPGAIRTPDPLVRSQILYPTELRAQGVFTIYHYNDFIGGERGIRTLDTDLSPYASLAGKCLRPLGQLSVFTIYEIVIATTRAR